MPSPFSRRRGLAAAVFMTVALVAVPAARAHRLDGPMSFIENQDLRVGVDLLDGGKITYLSSVRGPEAHDLLQDAQQSYYGGPPDGSWHVAASGATVLANRNDGRTIYTKVIPRKDSNGSRECRCTLETWITLVGNTVHVRNRLASLGGNTLMFTPHPQELPAVYTTGDAYRLYTYDGDKPYTGGSVHEITDDRGGFFVPGPSFLATEHWAALVNDDGFGLGLFEPKLTRFSGIPGSEYAAGYGWINGYVTASTTEVLESEPTYSYQYTLVVGSLEDIRGYAVQHQVDPRPLYLFRTDRQHWWELNATDAGGPVHGAFRLSPDHYDPQIYGPETSFPASGVRALYVRGAWHTNQDTAQLLWASDAGFGGDRVATFRVDTDGRFHTYRIPLAGLSAWTGIIRGLRLDFVDDRAEPGRWVDISCISWKPCPRAPRDERRLIRSKPPFAFLDSFDSSFNGSFWTQEQGTSGTTIETNQGRLVVTVGADAPNRDIVTGIDSTCVVAGNYDIRVDYRLLEWPARSGIGLDLEVDSGTVGRVSEPMDAYFVKFLPGGTLAATGDEAGSLRLVRAGRQLTAFYKHEGRWIWLWQSDGSTGNSRVRLSVDTNGWDFPHDEVQVAFDNFSVVRGRLLCP